MSKRMRDVLIVILILLVAKIGINFCYDKGWLSIEHFKYVSYVYNMEKINSEQLEDLISSRSDNEISLIYMGRESCSTCVELLPNIKKIFNEHKEFNAGGNSKLVSRYYFDSEKNRDKLAEEIRAQIGVDSVPVIIMIKGKEVKLFSGDELYLSDYLDQFTKYLEQ